MKILVFNWRDITHPCSGGAEVYLHEIGRRLSREHEVTLYCGGYEGCKRDDEIDGIKIVRRGGRFTLYLHAIFDYLFKLRKEGYDVVVDSINGVPFFTPLFVRKPKLAIIYHLIETNTFFRELPFPMSFIAWQAQRAVPFLYSKVTIVTDSPSSRQELIESGMSEERINVVYAATDCKTPDPAVKSAKPLISYVGRVKQYKQLDHLLQAFKVVRREIPGVELVIAGRGDFSELRKLVDGSELDSCITLAGEVSEEQKAEILRKTWVFVTPSKKEGWGITVLEANSCGALAIAYDVPGLRDSIKDRETGLLIRPPGDIEKLADGMIEVLTDSELRQELSCNALKWASSFDWGKSTEEFMAVVKAIDKPRAGYGRATMHKFTLWRLIESRIKSMLYLLRKRRFKMAYNYLWVSLFTRDSGAAILDPLYARFPRLTPYPKAIEVEVTTRCHLKCTICEHTYWNEKGRDMSFEEFKHIVDQFPKLKWMGITGIGSSFLNKDYLKMLRYLKSRSVYVELFDTFTQIDAKVAEELVEIGVDKICLSMDAATKETYEKIRVGASFGKVLDNVRTLIRLKEQMKTPIPELWFHYIVTRDNVYEMPQFVELVQSLKANKNSGSLLYWTDLLAFKQVKDLMTDIPEEVKQEVLGKGKELGIEMWWNQNFAPCEPITRCVRWTEPFILVTGHLQPCCVINEANMRHFQKENAVANLFEQDFRDVWRNEYKDLREMIRRGQVPEICAYCREFDLSLSRKGNSARRNPKNKSGVKSG